MSITKIALVGAGKGGTALLQDLIKIPDITVKYVCDINPTAEGMLLAQKYNIKTCLWANIESVLKDPEITLILEVTGQTRVFRHLVRNKLPTTNIMGSEACKIIFHFVDAQQQVTDELENYKKTLEIKIQQRTEELEWANKELKHKLADIENLNEKLQQINDAKTKYLLQATHQLKAPFAAIQSYVDVLLQGYAGQITDQAKDIIIKIKTRCQMLSKAIKNMLELANLNSYVEENIKLQTVSLEKIVKNVLETFIAVAEKKHISLIFKNLSKNDTISCNQEQIVIMLSNIVDNAIIYSPQNSEIKIVIEDKNNDKVCISVIDQGIGIPKQNIPKIFNEYFRSNNAAIVNENGTGLGLSIVKRIADIHKAEIEVESVVEKGTTIKIVFPKIKIISLDQNLFVEIKNKI